MKLPDQYMWQRTKGRTYSCKPLFPGHFDEFAHVGQALARELLPLVLLDLFEIAIFVFKDKASASLDETR